MCGRGGDPPLYASGNVDPPPPPPPPPKWVLWWPRAGKRGIPREGERIMPPFNRAHDLKFAQRKKKKAERGKR